MRIMKTPRSIDIDITNECNLRCGYCYHFTGPGDVKKDLPRDEWLEFFDELGRCGVMNVCLAGGEPFIRKDLKEILSGIIKNRMRFKLLSNGTLITDDMASYIASTGRCDSIQVSIDGATPDVHDLSRGKGSFERAIAGMQTLRGHRIPVTVRVTITRHNVMDLDRIASFLLEDIGLRSFSTNSAGPLGLCRKNRESMELTIGERQTAMETLLRLNARYNGRIGAMAGPLAEARHWKMMVDARKRGLKRMPNRGYLRACGGVMNKMAVRADGVMIPCTQMSHISLGRINKDKLTDVWQGHPEMKRLRERREIPLDSFGFCKGCDYIPLCTGSCPGLAYAFLEKEDHPSPDACLRRFLEAGGVVPS